MKTLMTDFRFTFKSAGHYIIQYTSPVTGKKWWTLFTNMGIVDEFKGTETNEHSQRRLNELKWVIKNR